MYFSIHRKSKELCLQWFPFSKLSKHNEEQIVSEEFFYKYVATGGFVLFDTFIRASENFIQKGDGSFRDASLVSPLLYLVLQAVGKEIYKQYIPKRKEDIEVYYAGNYDTNRATYKKDYDDFVNSINNKKDDYQYFIKTDITSFFNNINVDLLIKCIDKNCNNEKARISQPHLLLYKELLLYCGNGRFPLLENSVVSSFLATVVYLDLVDDRLEKFITNHINEFTSFRMIRYVDDMYILIASDQDFETIHNASNLIRNEYSSILKEYGLTLNSSKYCLKPVKEVKRELKRSLYSEGIEEDIKEQIGELFEGRFTGFICEIAETLKKEHIDVQQYNQLIEKHFNRSDIMITSSEVYNYYIYEDAKELTSADVICNIISIIKRDITFINIDPKRLTFMVTKTRNGDVIRALLKQLFYKHRNDMWNSYDTSIAISYLIQRGFQHGDLISVLRERCPDLYAYYKNFCERDFVRGFNNKLINKCCEIIGQDWKTIWLYFMYIIERKRNNHLAQYAFFKNFFDRLTADIACYFGNDKKSKKPNYRKYYKCKDLFNFYSQIEGSKDIIRRANTLRNNNPLAHSSSELIDKDNTSDEIKKCINDLKKLIYDYIKKH